MIYMKSSQQEETILGRLASILCLISIGVAVQIYDFGGGLGGEGPPLPPLTAALAKYLVVITATLG